MGSGVVLKTGKWGSVPMRGQTLQDPETKKPPEGGFFYGYPVD